ncbi:hypothetical protein GIW57_18440 [Stenotrophomonas sp. PA-6-5C]|uniref:hypothetical protein n=1 Tax=Stenotrophomonas sp. PA-6-5C TaxID=2665487 RepID=UPI001F1638C5|nr:hypothetical protein [Stenotrophomonas sp. PA-6-5C]MCF5092132.1 hypothetical protein [Stenotrophomonas sp. PA-6-5C]
MNKHSWEGESMCSYTLKQGEKADGTSKIFFIGSDGQLLEGEVHGLPSFGALLPSLAEKPAKCMSAAVSGSVAVSPAAQAFFRKMEKAIAERECERQRRKAMRRAGALDKRLPKAAPSKPQVRF